jgi:hypothetical protein
MTDQELLELVQRGANGVGDTAVDAARTACKIILEKGFLATRPEQMKQVASSPEKAHPAEKKVWAERPNDKGYKMPAKKNGTCNICTSPIAIGEDIYFKSGSGANHVACADEVGKLVP